MSLNNKIIFCLISLLCFLTGCMTALGLLVDHRNLEESSFSAYPIDAKFGKTKGSNSFIYEEVLANNSSRPFKIVYSKKRMESPIIGDIEESRNYSIKERFTTDTLVPNSEVSRKDVNFSIPASYGKTTQVTEYCGYYLDKNGKPIANNGRVVSEIKDGQFTCSLYKMTIDPGKAKEQMNRLFASIFNMVFASTVTSIVDYYNEHPCD